MKTRQSLPKVAVVGAGAVGMAFAYGVAMRSLARELVLVDLDARRAEGEAMDLSHATAYYGSLHVGSGGYEAARGADIYVVTAGMAQKPGQTRLELLAANARIVGAVMAEIAEASKDNQEDPIVILVSNPVDVMTAVAIEASDFAPGRVFGSGTVLDTGRFRRLLADHLAVDAKSVHAHVLGEHGDSEVCVWSTANVSNIPLAEFCRQRGMCMEPTTMERISTETRRAAYEIIDRKGATAYGIGAALCRVLEAVVRDAKSILTVSAPSGGLHGLAPEVCLALPSVVGAGGVEAVLETSLDATELEGLRHSGGLLHQALTGLKDMEG